MAKTTIDKTAAGAGAADADDNTALTDYQALTPIKHDGVLYPSGASIALAEAAAQALRQVGAIGSPVNAAEQKAKALALQPEPSADNSGEPATE